jgi:hypothetical protein
MTPKKKKKKKKTPDQTQPNPKKANASSFAGKSNKRASQVQSCGTQGMNMNIHPWILLPYWMQGKVKAIELPSS